VSYDILHGEIPGDFSRNGASRRVSGTGVGSLPTGAAGYAPASWWTAEQAEGKVQEFMARGGLFATKLPRESAERKTLEFLRSQRIGIMSGTMGSWLLSDKEQKRLLGKIDDVRYDLRLVSRRAAIGMGCVAGALGLLGIASIYRTGSSGEKAKGYGQLNRFGR
jgi:hypothetical protein